MPPSRPGLSLVAWAALLGALCSCLPVRPPPSREEPGRLRYHVTYVREPRHALEVGILRVGEGAPRDFLFSQPGGVERVRIFGADGSERELPVSAEGHVLVPPDTRSLRYRYVLDASRRGRHAGFFTGQGEDDARQVAGRAWLLRPRSVGPALRAELVVEGVDALLPWVPDARGVYQLQGDDLVNSGFHSFGGRRCTVRLPGGVLEVAVLGRPSHMDDAALCAWLERSAREVLTVRRSFPYPRVTVGLVTVPAREDPVPFGMVLWSTPPSISLWVGQDAAPAAFTRDWVAVHELLHLAHPPIFPRVAWLSEGLATYYTELARARSGRQTPERAWVELLAGFERARRAVGSRTMEDVVTRGDSYLGTYWTGALVALHLDVELRRLTGNTRGLDDVLERLAESGPAATFDAFGAAVDAIAGRPLFHEVLSRHLPRPALAELEPLLEALGVEPAPDGVRLGIARDSTLRDALVAPR
ncbi:hypothetical protein ATI61_108323 [Archangium gephyra]|uniref:Peptidase M61 catalytic domain-containing protein n=1 Tax=Archangium gephyra TaxID=48 RepID=A0ABX9JXB3_9BACT|nr:hypothetical protein [Archangium gephyra]REG28781.1 hypothetical protein ATI61_108323 [Archangium gephyra]